MNRGYLGTILAGQSHWADAVGAIRQQKCESILCRVATRKF